MYYTPISVGLVVLQGPHRHLWLVVAGLAGTGLEDLQRPNHPGTEGHR